MATPVISVNHISKRYILGNRWNSKEGLRHAIERAVRAPFARFGRRGAPPEEFWALRDVSFDVRQGEAVGIIGHNGAGKSTVLKILSRITEPTSGSVRIRGRVASLLEVGTGFHPDLTGRENIFLNGAILGMSRSETMQKFDQIVSFAEVEQFLDTPVKRYSSGMHMRLAFAVAAHLDPEILIVDEVLAVGDTQFQKKCIDRMTEVGKNGRTVLFVTHNLAALRALCQRAVVLRSGAVVLDGTVDDAISCYQRFVSCSGDRIDLSTVPRTTGARDLLFDKCEFVNAPLEHGKPIVLRLRLRSAGRQKRFPELDFGISVRDKEGNTVFHCSNRFTSTPLTHESDDDWYFFEVENFLRPNTYYMSLYLRTQETRQEWLPDAVSFLVEGGNPYGFFRNDLIHAPTLPQFRFRKE